MLDVFFLSYYESDASEHFAMLKEKAGHAVMISGVPGIMNAHRECAKRSTTKNFYVVDADAILVDSFDFSFTPSNSIEEYPNVLQSDCAHVWHSINPVNGLQYGYGGVKCFPKSAFTGNIKQYVDMTTSLSAPLVVRPKVSNITYFNTTEFDSWKSAFRECVKLSSAVIKNGNDSETQHRLDTWCNIADTESEYYKFVLYGANQGKFFGEDYCNDHDALAYINDFLWLKQVFNESRNDVV